MYIYALSGTFNYYGKNIVSEIEQDVSFTGNYYKKNIVVQIEQDVSFTGTKLQYMVSNFVCQLIHSNIRATPKSDGFKNRCV